MGSNTERCWSIPLEELSNLMCNSSRSQKQLLVTTMYHDGTRLGYCTYYLNFFFLFLCIICLCAALWESFILIQYGQIPRNIFRNYFGKKMYLSFFVYFPHSLSKNILVKKPLLMSIKKLTLYKHKRMLRNFEFMNTYTRKSLVRITFIS